MSASLCYNRCLSIFSFFQYSPSWSTGVLLWRQWGEAVGNWTYGFVVCFCYILIIVFFAENKITIIYRDRLISLFESDFLFLWNTSGINALEFRGSPLPINYLLQCRINYINPQNDVPPTQQNVGYSWTLTLDCLLGFKHFPHDYLVLSSVFSYQVGFNLENLVSRI